MARGGIETLHYCTEPMLGIAGERQTYDGFFERPLVIQPGVINVCKLCSAIVTGNMQAELIARQEMAKKTFKEPLHFRQSLQIAARTWSRLT
jgi:hypothetical protein